MHVYIDTFRGKNIQKILLDMILHHNTLRERMCHDYCFENQGQHNLKLNYNSLATY